MGQWVTVAGPNGAGKTTLVKILAGLEKTYSNIEIFNMQLNKKNLYKIRKDIGFVFDVPENFFACETVEDELAFSLENMAIAPSVIKKKIKDISRKSTDEIVNYFDCSDKNVLIALDNHNDIKRMTDMLIGYNVDISTAGSISELTELLRSDKTFDLVFLSNTISGIENYNIDTDEDLKRTFTKLSLVAGYKLQIVIVSLHDYKKNDIEFLLMPISKVELDDIMVKYLSEK